MRLLLVYVLLQLVLVQSQQVQVLVQLVSNLLQMVLQLRLQVRTLLLKVMQQMLQQLMLPQLVLYQMHQVLLHLQAVLQRKQLEITLLLLAARLIWMMSRLVVRSKLEQMPLRQMGKNLLLSVLTRRLLNMLQILLQWEHLLMLKRHLQL